MAKRVLVVDDEPNIVMSLGIPDRARRALRLTVARNGGEALAALDGHATGPCCCST